jgi:hypothetical protein
VAQDRATPLDGSGESAMGDRPAGHPVAYRERLLVPWWTWPVALAFAAFLASEVFLGAPTALAWVPYVVLLSATTAGLLVLGRIVVRVDGEELHVDDAHLPVRLITEVNVLDPEAKRAVLGPVAERYAFVVQRPWIGSAVRIVIDDPEDPTPYWIVSSRQPAKLAAAIVAARDTAGPSPHPGGAG